MPEVCERCGANLALVGRMHNCRPRVVELASTPDPVIAPLVAQADPEVSRNARSSTAEPAAHNRTDAGSTPAGPTKKRAPRGTFDRRAYQRDLMRKRRKQKAKRDGKA